MSASRRIRARLQFLIIVAVAVASLGGAWLLFEQARDGALWGTTNRGTFVDPPLTVAQLQIDSVAGEPFEAGKWWLWVVPRGPCEQACLEVLHQLRQLHVLLNRDAARVRRALLTSGDADAGQLLETYPRLRLLSGNLARLERGIYIVDPLGTVVFHYTMSQAGEDVLDDLKRLLKVSQIG